MTPEEYGKLVSAHGLRGQKTIAACGAVLVNGLTAYAAAHKIGVEESVISRALARLRRPVCPTCGPPIKKN